MRIYRAKDYYDMSRKAANIISAQVIMKPDCVLGLATGSTPVGTYAQLVEWYKKGDLDFSEVKTVNLDEYKGLDRSNDQSYFYFMAEHLFDKVNIDFQNVNIPNGVETDADKECARYEAKIKALGGVDLQLLGIGHNGHIGFNEPNGQFDRTTHCVNLTQSTIEANKRFFASEEDAAAGVHDGNQDDHAGEQDSDGGKRGRQGGDCKTCLFRTDHTGGACIGTAASQRCDTGGR
mgnify:CR=1 FL=1